VKKYAPLISVTAWLISLVAVLWYPNAAWAVVATSVNLIHARWTQHSAGKPFAIRVREVLDNDIDNWQSQLQALEKGVEDVKEAQIRIAGQFRGARP
jgi:hypothetical protein